MSIDGFRFFIGDFVVFLEYFGKARLRFMTDDIEGDATTGNHQGLRIGGHLGHFRNRKRVLPHQPESGKQVQTGSYST